MKNKFDPLYELTTDLDTLLRFRQSGWQAYTYEADDRNGGWRGPFPSFLFGHWEVMRWAQEQIEYGPCERQNEACMI